MAGFLLSSDRMNALKTIGRMILILLMIPVVLQLALGVIGIVVVIVGNQKPDAISYLLGQSVGALLFLTLFITLFRKLGKKSSEVTHAPHSYQATGALATKSSKIILR